MILKKFAAAGGLLVTLCAPAPPPENNGPEQHASCHRPLPIITALEGFKGPVSGPLFLRNLQTGKTPGTFNLISMNTQNLPDFVLERVNPGYRNDRRDCLSSLAEVFDVAALQENWVGLSVDRYLPTVRTGFNPLSTGGWSMTYRSGLSISSPLPMRKENAQAYSVCSGWTEGANDCVAMKGFETVRFGDITIVNTHLDAGHGTGDERARLIQMSELSAALPKTGRLILVGDFNTYRQSAADNRVLQRLLADNGLTLAARSDKGFDVIAVRGVKVNWVGQMEDPALTDHPVLTANLNIS